MSLHANHISHYFELDYGPLLNICDLDSDETHSIIEREREAVTGFNRFSHGKDFFDYRKIADDLLLQLYSEKFDRLAPRRPYYAVLGDADVVAGLYRNPHKITIPIEAFEEHELTFMCPDHFHLVGLSNIEVKNHFGLQAPEGYKKEELPYFGKLLTYTELKEQFHELKIDLFLDENKRTNYWYRYVEAQIWADPQDLRSRFNHWVEVDPEPWSTSTITYLQNYKEINSYISTK